MTTQGWDFPILAVDRVVDGDTVDVLVDVGFRLTAVQRFRVLGVDTPERGQPGFREAGEFTLAWLVTHGPALRVRSQKADSFGRWLGDFYDAGSGEDLTGALIASGHAQPYPA